MSKLKDIPTTPHWAILTDLSLLSVSLPITGRNKTIQATGYEVFTSKQEWEAEIRKREKEREHYSEKFMAIKVTPVEITRKVIVDIK